jgi:predicted transcriptional regulator
MKSHRPRHNLYLDDDLSAALERLGARPGTSKSAIMTDALRAYFNSQATRDIDDRLKTRLDRISTQLGRIERDGQILLETLSLYVRYQLTVTAPLPEADKAAQAVGRERFRRFVDQVGRQLATGRTLGDVSADATANRLPDGGAAPDMGGAA